MKKALFFLLTSASLGLETKPQEPHMEISTSSQTWISFVKVNSALSGTFTAQDALGQKVIFKWQRTDILSSDLATFKKEIADLACKALAPQEVQFLKAYPEAVSQEIFLKPCEPLLEDSVVDWVKVEERIASTMRQFYLTDLSTFGAAVIKPLLDDVYFLVSVKDESGQLLGFAMLAITPALLLGNVKLINIATLPEEHSGLDLLLFSSIFQIVPNIERIFLYVRPTNAQTLQKYQSFGFAKGLSPIEDPNHKVNMNYLMLLEYRARQSSILQRTASVFKNPG